MEVQVSIAYWNKFSTEFRTWLLWKPLKTLKNPLPHFEYGTFKNILFLIFYFAVRGAVVASPHTKEEFQGQDV